MELTEDDCQSCGELISKCKRGKLDLNAEASYSEYHRNDAEGEGK